MVLSFPYRYRQPDQVLAGAPWGLRPGRTRAGGATGPAVGESARVETLGRPVLEAGAQRETTRGQHFLDLVERLATQVRGLEQLGLGALDEVADVVDVLGLEAVGRTDGELELVDRAQQDRIEVGLLLAAGATGLVADVGR